MTKEAHASQIYLSLASWADNAGYEASPISFSGMHRKSETIDEDPGIYPGKGSKR